MIKPVISASVPCNGCTACCYDEVLILHPENGDVPGQYLTRKVINPLTGKPALALQHKADGACVYLAADGCSIHDRAPAICREFDCRKMFASLGASKIRKLVECGRLSPKVEEAARARRHSLAQVPA